MLWAGAIIELGRLVRSGWRRRLVWGLMVVVIKRMEPKRMIEVHPNHLKKFVSKKYNAQKDMIRLHAWKRWAFEHDNMDIVDAYCAAQWARCTALPQEFASDQVAVVKDYMRLKDVAFVTGDE